MTYNIDAGKAYTELAFAFIHHAVAFNLTNCNVNRLRLNVNEATIDNCDFTLTTNSGFDGYCIYYYGNNNSEVIVKNSRFNTAGKAIVMYSESAKVYNLDVVDCTFTSSNASTDKAAIQMHTELGISGTLDITRCTATGFADVNGGLWNEINNGNGTPTNKFTITVDGKTLVRTQAQFEAAIKAGQTEIDLFPGTYKITSVANNKKLTIKGEEDAIIDVRSGLSYATGANITFEGITIQSDPEGAGYTNGFADFKYAIFKKCVIDGTLGLDFSCEFNECTFNIEGDYYNLWTWGAGAAKFNKCTFNSDGKSLLVYANVLDNNSDLQTINITECTFNDKGTIAGKAAIEIGNDYNKSYNLVVNNTTVNGFDINPNGIKTNTTLWANKNSMPKEKLNVVVDGVDVY